MSPFVSVRFLATQSDARLLALARRGHERAFEALVHRYRRPLLAHCRRLLGSEARAEDGLQQGLMQAWIALQQGTEVREARPWLYRVVHNASLNLLRGRVETAGLEEVLEAASSGEGDVERRLAVRDALASVASLPLLQREALLRTAVDGDSHEQVAAALGLSDGAVRGLIYRARATLRAGVTAVTPAPVANWMAATAARRPGPPLSERLAELLGGGGSAGASAALLKGGAAVITAGAVAAGVAAPVVHLGATSPRPATATTLAPSSSHNRTDASSGPPASAAPNIVAERIGSTAPTREAGHPSGGPGEHGGRSRAPAGPGGTGRGPDDRSHPGSDSGPSDGGSTGTSTGSDGGASGGPLQVSGSGPGGGATPSGGGSGSTPGGPGPSSGGPGPSSGGPGPSSGGSGSTPGGPGPAPSGGSDGGVSGSSGSSDDLLGGASSGSGMSGSGTSGSSDGMSGRGGTSGPSTPGGSTTTSGSSTATTTTTTGTSGPH